MKTTASETAPIDGRRALSPVAWLLAGQTVRLRFSMKNAKLYSFQFR